MLLHMVSALALVPLLISRAAAWTLPPQGLILRADNSPGLGIEFEYRQITLGSDIQTTTAGDLKKVKGAVIILNNNEVKGDNWELTAEHESETSIGLLTPEWIIDGKTVALGSGQATKATSEIIDQMVRLNRESLKRCVPNTGQECLATVQTQQRPSVGQGVRSI